MLFQIIRMLLTLKLLLRSLKGSIGKYSVKSPEAESVDVRSGIGIE
jgi:hypothetical protein